MWLLKAPSAVLGLVAIALAPSAFAKPYPVHIEELRELHNASQVVKRQCAGTICGDQQILCCPNGQACGVNALTQAICVPGTEATAAPSYVYYTSLYTESGVVTRTSIWSSPAGNAAPEPTSECGASQTGCGSVCCDGGYYCFAAGTCKQIGGGSSPGVTGIVNPSAPTRPTSSTLIVLTVTGSPTATLPFSTPIPTGVNGTLAESNQGGGGLSGGAIAGIVIGVILGIILLLLICFYCCAKAAFDSVLALIGLGGRKRKRTHEETTYIEEHHHGGSAAAGGRRWYGQGSSKPSRPAKKSGGMGNLLGVGAGLAGLAAVLGMKRKNDKRHDEKSTVSGTSYYTYGSSDYTSSSSASSDDRRTRHTRQSSRR